MTPPYDHARQLRQWEAEDAYRRAAARNIAAGIVPCRWFALCDHPATTTRNHPILGDVPVCDRCNQKVEALAVDNIEVGLQDPDWRTN